MTPRGVPDVTGLRERWTTLWPDALRAWGPYTRLHAPQLRGPGDVPAGVGSFAWFSLGDVEVNVDLAEVLQRGLEEHAVAVLAHEVGHHVYSPGDLLTAGRLAAQARLGLIDQDQHIGLVTNLWSDLLINDRLQVSAGADMAGVWRALGPPHRDDAVMRLVLRTDEILWSLPAGSLAGRGPHHDAEAGLLARLVRTYADDPVGGVGGFAMVLRPFLGESQRAGAGRWCEHTEREGTAVPGLANDPSTVRRPVHPALDHKVVGTVPDDDGQEPRTGAGGDGADDAGLTTVSTQRSGGNTLSPADYAAVLRALGTTTDPREAAAQWYREHAREHLVPFPVRTADRVEEPLLAGHDVWDVGDDLADVDWTATLLASPVVLPGVTTVQRHYDADDGHEPERLPVDLDLYLDSSGSMPDPAATGAPIALAGAILALSALRSGARVQATTWSGPRQIAGTRGFTRDTDAVLRAIVAHFGGSTAFPVQLLERTHLGDAGRATSRSARRHRSRHIAVISDDGVTTMFTDGGWTLPDGVDPTTTVAARAVRAAGGGGTLVLDAHDVERIAAMAPGYDVYRVTDMESMVTFARDFARRLWGQETTR